MDYYNELRPGAEATVRVFAKNVTDCTSAISKIEKRLTGELENIRNFEQRVKILKEKAGESLLGDTGSYEKFKTSLQKLTTLLNTAVEIVGTFQNELLPAKKTELEESRRKLDKGLQVFLEAKRPLCEAAMTEHVDAAVHERDDFLEAVERLFCDYGLIFKPGRADSIIPRTSHPRIDLQRPGCVILWRPPLPI